MGKASTMDLHLTKGLIMLKGWKTFTYASGLILAVLSLPEFQTLISNYPQASVIVNGVVIMLLRAITSTPIGKSDK